MQSWQHSSHAGANGKTEKRRKDKELQHIASDVQIIFSHTTGSLSQPIWTPNSSSVTNPPNRAGLKTFNIPWEIVIFYLPHENVGTVQPKQFSHPVSVIICYFPSLYHTSTLAVKIIFPFPKTDKHFVQTEELDFFPHAASNKTHMDINRNTLRPGSCHYTNQQIK